MIRDFCFEAPPRCFLEGCHRLIARAAKPQRVAMLNHIAFCAAVGLNMACEA
jgi:hypothetical protein